MVLTNFVECFCEFRSKIEELESTKMKTDHGNGTYSSARIFPVYIFFGKSGDFFVLQKKNSPKKNTLFIEQYSSYCSLKSTW